MSIGKRIEKLRHSKKLSGEKFGELCGVSKGAVSQWENDLVIPTLDKVLELKKHINFSLDWLYTGSESIAEEISNSLDDDDRQRWIHLGHSFVESTKKISAKK